MLPLSVSFSILVGILASCPSSDAFSVGSTRPISRRTTTATTTFLLAKPSKWDNLVDEDEDEFDDIPATADMTYEPRNVKRAHDAFMAIRGAGGKELTNDMYIRDPNDLEVFWYLGKVARVSDVSLERCVARQWSMIERHATSLRPKELYPHRGRLELWSAPGDCELEVAYNRPGLKFTEMFRDVEGASKVSTVMIGFQGEVYGKGEDGFRTWRTDEGLPARPELNPGGESRPPTDEEYAEIQSQLQGEDAKSD